MTTKYGTRVATSGLVKDIRSFVYPISSWGMSFPWTRRELKSFLAAMYGNRQIDLRSILGRQNYPFLLGAFPMLVVVVPVMSQWIWGLMRYCRVVEPGVTVSRAELVLVCKQALLLHW